MKNFKLLFIMATLLCFSLASCSKNEQQDIHSNKVKTAKFTFSIEGLEKDDIGHFGFSSANAEGNTTIWKVNGETKSNQNLIHVTEDVLKSGAVCVVELLNPVVTITAGLSIVNNNSADGGSLSSPIVYSYKAEINGDVVKDIKQQAVVVGEVVNLQFQY
ncbi:hypothetical protein [Sphingobacterium paucimobilis]|uniref:Lipid/polyisoprenoid-binding YceI-like domain-containing protein n=1 Tax=Sphingobacterium paucimobilis HER1398 TaxID=1346330 RepID=U2HPR8_9SPHI|nr:hypothetical protein [Sphingobacterium paucimobilis]ERJ57457.1 hypothetical protein M472_01625 [Sphingobacterium paucimobilis HER1398]